MDRPLIGSGLRCALYIYNVEAWVHLPNHAILPYGIPSAGNWQTVLPSSHEQTTHTITPHEKREWFERRPTRGAKLACHELRWREWLTETPVVWAAGGLHNSHFPRHFRHGPSQSDSLFENGPAWCPTQTLRFGLSIAKTL